MFRLFCFDMYYIDLLYTCMSLRLWIFKILKILNLETISIKPDLNYRL